MLIVDNADVLMMQNWEHVLSVFENLHLQPKKNHDVDFSRVRYWLLEGHARYYRQTILFSRIPAPVINNIFNKYCQNFAGKCQTDVLKSVRYQLGTICQIGFQLGQIFHRLECDSPLELPDLRFNFFIEKILPKFRDDMMSHTLIFIPSYFDFVKIRNYFKKNDLSSMDVSEYADKKSVERARYLFFHGKVHFMMLTERFYFYKRYKIRGINHLIFYELPHYAEYYPKFCNFLPDPKRKNLIMDNFSSTVLYSKYDAQKLCATVGQEKATHMLNSDKNVHMFMTE
jgi:U3 small nucleolar RNA-associated protein 25